MTDKLLLLLNDLLETLNHRLPAFKGTTDFDVVRRIEDAICEERRRIAQGVPGYNPGPNKLTAEVERLSDFQRGMHDRLIKLESAYEKLDQRNAAHAGANAQFHLNVHQRIESIEGKVVGLGISQSMSRSSSLPIRLGDTVMFTIGQDMRLEHHPALVTGFVVTAPGYPETLDLIVLKKNGTEVAHAVPFSENPKINSWRRKQ